MSTHTTRWAYLPIQNDGIVSEIASDLYSHLPSNQFDIEENPHITIHGRFNIPKDQQGIVEDVLDTYSFSEREITATGITCWPSIEKPVVISLEVSLDLSTVQDEIQEVVVEAGGVNAISPAPAHVTLVRSSECRGVDEWCGVSEGVTAVIRGFISRCERFPFRVFVSPPRVSQSG